MAFYNGGAHMVHWEELRCSLLRVKMTMAKLLGWANRNEQQAYQFDAGQFQSRETKLKLSSSLLRA